MEEHPLDIAQHTTRLTKTHLWLAIGLAVAGAALLGGSFFLPGSPTQQVFSLIPTPTWAPFPTRAIAPIMEAQPGPAAMATYHLRISLLTKALDVAQDYWEERQFWGDLDDQEWYLGATLAVQQNDLDVAADRTLAALAQDSANPQYWQALAMIYRRMGQAEAAAQCLSIADTYRSESTTPLDNFDERWHIALQTRDHEMLLNLAILHTQEQPVSALDAYYTGKALLLSNEYTPTIDTLINVISPTGQAPAVLWYTLGEAYYAAGGFNEAIAAYETALNQYAQGDTSLYIGLIDPLTELNWQLAQAYFNADHCAEAESVFRRWENTQIDAQQWISRAVICQTPTPTPTPWILSQQSTPTPTP